MRAKCLALGPSVFQTLAAVLILDTPLIIRWVNMCFLYMREILGSIRNNQSIIQQSYKVLVLGQNFLQLHCTYFYLNYVTLKFLQSAENPDNFCGK